MILVGLAPIAAAYFIVWLVHFTHKGHPDKYPKHPVRVGKLLYEVVSLVFSYLFGAPLKIARVHLSLMMEKQKSYCSKEDIDYGSWSRNSALDVYYQVAPHDLRPVPNARVILFVYGGGWNSGSKRLYAPIGANLSKRGFVAVIPNYCLWPAAPTAMIHDIKAAISWTQQHIHEFGGDPRKIVIVAHSAGAHLVNLALLDNALDNCHAALSLHNGKVHGLTKYHSAHSWALSRCLFLMQQASIDLNRNAKSNSSKYGPIHDIQGVVLIGGPYDIANHYRWESKRGVENVSCMARLFGDSEESFAKYSPSYLLLQDAKMDPLIQSGLFVHYLPSNWLILHSPADKVVPLSSSELLFDGMERIGIRNLCLRGGGVELHSGNAGKGHADLIYALFLDEDAVYTELELFYARIKAVVGS
ncbi:hypothetical protein HDU91_000213 [Kappamyces sp. JEL0680]|nr:hypothetical protein HDU91_000213 [Kappamyces sp. JEL0680]